MRFDYVTLLASFAIAVQAGPTAWLYDSSDCAAWDDNKASYPKNMDSQKCFESAGRSQVWIPNNDKEKEWCLQMSYEFCGSPKTCWDWNERLLLNGNSEGCKSFPDRDWVSYKFLPGNCGKYADKICP